MDTRKEHEFKHKLMQARNGQSPKAPNLEEAQQNKELERNLNNLSLVDLYNKTPQSP